jgi:hypothetical protein
MLTCVPWQSVASIISVVLVDGSAACQIEVICADSLMVGISQTHSWSQDTYLRSYCSSDIVIFSGCVLTISQVSGLLPGRSMDCLRRIYTWTILMMIH